MTVSELIELLYRYAAEIGRYLAGPPVEGITEAHLNPQV